MQPHQRRTAIAQELKPFISCTRWPHDNSPLPNYLITLARPHPTAYTTKFDEVRWKSWYRRETVSRFSSSMLFGLCLMFPILVMMLWLTAWCPEESREAEIESLSATAVDCDHIEPPMQMNTSETQNCTTQASSVDSAVESLKGCSDLTRYTVLALFLVVLGCPSLLCLLCAIAPIIDFSYYYCSPLGAQLYVNYPEVPGGFAAQNTPQARLVNHIRALTLLYTVHTLNRRPLSSTDVSCCGKMRWACNVTHHYQWGRCHRDWVLRADVRPDGSVLCEAVDRRWTAADVWCEKWGALLERMGMTY